MPSFPPPYWEPPLDRPKLAAVGAMLALVVLGSLLRGCGGDDAPRPVRAPEIGTPPPAVVAAGAPVTVSGRAASGVTVVLLDDDRPVPGAEVTADADGRFAVGAPDGLREGAHRLSVVARDALGQTAASTPFSLTIASATPTPTATPTVPTFSLQGTPVPWLDLTDAAALTWPSLAGDLAPGEMPTLRGAAAAGADIRFWEGATPIGATQADAEGRWTFPLPDLAPGTHRLRVVVGGRDGGVASGDWVVTVAGAPATAAATARPATGTPAAPAAAATGTPTALR